MSSSLLLYSFIIPPIKKKKMTQGFESFLSTTQYIYTITEVKIPVFLSVLVEMRGVEPLSNILSIYVSPSAVCYLVFPVKFINKQTNFTSSHLFYLLF